jgi:hypothetical protein
MQILVLALYAAVYPTLLAAVAILLASPRRTQLLTVFLLAGLTVSVALGVGIVLLIRHSGAVAHKGSGWSWGTDLAVGGLALLLALALWTHAWQRLRARRGSRPHRAADAEPWSQRLLTRGSVPIVIAASIAINLPGAVYLVALKDIAADHDSVPVDLALVLAFNLIMFGLAELPWLGLLFAPARTEAAVERASDFLAAHGRKIAIVVCVVVGVHLVVRGAIRS